MTVREAMAAERERKQSEKAAQKKKLADLRAKDPELTDRELGDRLGISVDTVRTWKAEAKVASRQSSGAPQAA